MAFPRLYTKMVYLLLLTSISYNSTTALETTQQDQDKKVEAVIKCGSCPCVNPCSQSQPPPPPPPPKVQCSPAAANHPPPPPRFVYVTSVPEQPWQANIIPNNNNWQYFYGAAETTAKNTHLLFSSVFSTIVILLHLWAF